MRVGRILLSAMYKPGMNEREKQKIQLKECVCVFFFLKRQREPRVLTCTFLIYARTQSLSQAYYKIIRDVVLNNFANRPVDKTNFFFISDLFQLFHIS